MACIWCSVNICGKMNRTESIKYGKVKALEARWVCLRSWGTPLFLCFFPDNNLSMGLFPWLTSIFLWDYILVSRNLVLSHCPTLLSPFLALVFLTYIYTLFNSLNRGCIYKEKPSSIFKMPCFLDISKYSMWKHWTIMRNSYLIGQCPSL